MKRTPRRPANIALFTFLSRGRAVVVTKGEPDGRVAFDDRLDEGLREQRDNTGVPLWDGNRDTLDCRPATPREAAQWWHGFDAACADGVLDVTEPDWVLFAFLHKAEATDADAPGAPALFVIAVDGRPITTTAIPAPRGPLRNNEAERWSQTEIERVLKRCGLIVQKEDFLRPDGTPLALLHALYAAIPPIDRDWPGETKNIYHQRNYCGPSPFDHEAVRCVGNHNGDRDPAFPRMHNKFVVFARRIPPAEAEHHYQTWRREAVQDGWFTADRDAFYRRQYADQLAAPYAVWTGSFNFANNATASLENALLIRQPAIAQAYAREWGQIAGLSEPLDWRSPWAAPDVRIGS